MFIHNRDDFPINRFLTQFKVIRNSIGEYYEKNLNNPIYVYIHIYLYANRDPQKVSNYKLL